jgi:PAS domain S-box-containing protein
MTKLTIKESREQKLLKNERHLLKTLIETIPDSVWLKDTNGNYITCNLRFEKFIGAKEADLIGKSDYDFFTKELAEFFRQKDKEALQSGKSTTNQEWVTFAEDGHRELLETIKTPMYSSDGKLLGIQGIARDITKQHLAEEALKESEKQYKYLFENNPVPMWIFDDKTLEFLEVNTAAIKHYGYTRQEFLTMTIKEIRPEEDVEILNQIMATQRDALHEVGIWRHKKKNGEIVFVELIAHLIEYEGRIARLVLAFDVTQRKSAEDELRKLSRAIEQSPVSVIITNKQGDIEYVNPKFTRLTGYGSEEAIGKNPRFLKSKSTLPDEYKKLWETISSGGEWHGEFKNLKKNGEEYFELVSISPILNEKGQITHFLAVKEDITDRKRIENDLHKFMLGIENSSDAIFVTDINGTIEFINPAFEKIYGYPKSEVLGKTPRIIKSGLMPPEVYKFFWDTLLRGDTLKGEIKNKSKDGKIIDIEGSNSPILDEKGKIIGFLSINRDITKRKEAEEALRLSEEKYRKIFQNVQDVFYQADLSGLIIDISPSIFRIMGYLPEELLGKPITLLYENSELRGNLLDSIEQKGAVLDYEIRVKTKSGEIKYVSLNAHKLFDSSGNQIGIEGSARDISERKQAETELILAKEKAEESDRLKTAFLHNISHEIRTPMNAITGFTALLGEPDNSPETQAYYIETVQNSTNQLLSIICDIVDISSITANIIKKNITLVSLYTTTKSLLNQFRLRAAEQDVLLELHSGHSANKIEIMTDSTKLKQVLSNLINNALKFTTKGKIEFGYDLKGEFVEFYVSDTGIGIEQEYYTKIFDPFYQIESSLFRQFEGTGLGLSICKAYVEHLGGKIWLTSEPGKGSFFYFTIPFCPSETKTLKDTQTDPIRSFVPKTILVVEDDENNLKLIESIFKNLNSKLLHAVNGEEAVEICKSQKNIDLVLMDINMPVMNGFQAAMEIKKINPDIIIIAQTAYYDDKQKALDSGCSDHISKPFTKELLLGMIKKHFEIE